MAALPRKLKNMNVFEDGVSFLGLAKSVTIPKVARKMEAWRGGGLDSGAKIDMGGPEDLDLEHSYGGFIPDFFRKVGDPRVDAVMVRFAGAYQRDDTGQVDLVEVVIKGRHEEVDPGDAEAGEDTELKVKTNCVYYKLSINGVDLVEIDIMNMVYKTGGIDRLQQIRNAIGA